MVNWISHQIYKYEILASSQISHQLYIYELLDSTSQCNDVKYDTNMTKYDINRKQYITQIGHKI